MKRYNLCVVLVSLMPPSSAVLLADPQWTSSDEHTCSRMETTSLLKLCWESERDLPCQRSNQQLAQWNTISSLEFSPSCHHVVWWRRKAWYLETRGFIPKKIQWHIHAGLWSLVNWCVGSLYEALYKMLMNINENGCWPYGWPRPWWWSVYPRDTPTIFMRFLEKSAGWPPGVGAPSQNSWIRHLKGSLLSTLTLHQKIGAVLFKANLSY